MGEQRTEKLQAAEDKEVSVVENMESDIKVQFSLHTVVPEMYG